jgi:hypothetical protein
MMIGASLGLLGGGQLGSTYPPIWLLFGMMKVLEEDVECFGIQLSTRKAEVNSLNAASTFLSVSTFGPEPLIDGSE